MAGFRFRTLTGESRPGRNCSNAFIRATNMFHVCPLLSQVQEGPLHIHVLVINQTEGTVICERIKLIDPNARSCSRIDRLPYGELMNVPDALQGIFEYD